MRLSGEIAAFLSEIMPQYSEEIIRKESYLETRKGKIPRDIKRASETTKLAEISNKKGY